MQLPQARVVDAGELPGWRPPGRELPPHYESLLWLPTIVVSAVAITIAAIVWRSVHESSVQALVGAGLTYVAWTALVAVREIQNEVALVRHGVVTAAEVALVEVPERGLRMRLTYAPGHYLERAVRLRPPYLVVHRPDQPKVAHLMRELLGSPTIEGDRVRLAHPRRGWTVGGVILVACAVTTLVTLAV